LIGPVKKHYSEIVGLPTCVGRYNNNDILIMFLAVPLPVHWKRKRGGRV